MGDKKESVAPREMGKRGRDLRCWRKRQVWSAGIGWGTSSSSVANHKLHHRVGAGLFPPQRRRAIKERDRREKSHARILLNGDGPPL
eukprot:8879825-Pyramimonas_sp.AAC.1